MSESRKSKKSDQDKDKKPHEKGSRSTSTSRSTETSTSLSSKSADNIKELARKMLAKPSLQHQGLLLPLEPLASPLRFLGFSR